MVRTGRPRREDAETRKFSIRLTPCDGEKIEWNETAIHALGAIKLLAGEEVGGQNGKLHYHLYLESKLSDTAMSNALYKLARWTPHLPRGNSVFAKTLAHEGTEGYSVKDGLIVARHGYSESDLDAIVEQSQQYRRDMETNRKSKSRATQKTMKSFIDEISESTEVAAAASHIVFAILQKYEENDMMFPSRSQMENAVMTVMARKGRRDYVQEYYMKNM